LSGYEAPSCLLHFIHDKLISNVKVIFLAQLFKGILYTHVEAQIFGELKLARLVWENFVGLLDTFLILDCEVGCDIFVQVGQKFKSYLRCDA
jgi:hypothetical protein